MPEEKLSKTIHIANQFTQRRGHLGLHGFSNLYTSANVSKMVELESFRAIAVTSPTCREYLVINLTR